MPSTHGVHFAGFLYLNLDIMGWVQLDHMSVIALQVVACLVFGDGEWPDTGVSDYLIVTQPDHPSRANVMREWDEYLFFYYFGEVGSMSRTELSIEDI